MLLRVLTAAVAIPVVLFLNYVGGRPFAAGAALAAFIGTVEFCQMARRAGFRPAMGIASSSSAGLAALPLLVARPAQPALVGLLVLTLFAAGVWTLWQPLGTTSLAGLALTMVPPLYLGVLLGHLSLLRNLHDGAWWILTVFITTWAYDTGAFFAGSGFGRRPFMRRISPNKTVEGVAGGLILSTIAATTAVPTLGITIGQSLLLGLVIGAMAQLGDLIESAIKRLVGVKDSGWLIPGHGGLLDRIDSLLFTGAVTFYAAALLGYAS